MPRVLLLACTLIMQAALLVLSQGAASANARNIPGHSAASTMHSAGTGLPDSDRVAAAQIICDGGTVSGQRCECPRGWTLTKRSANRYTCTQPKVRPIVCQNGFVRGGQCSCPRNMNRKRLSPNRYRCVCNTGLRLVRGRCVRPER